VTAEYYKARLMFNVQPEHEVTLTARLPKELHAELRAFCKQQGIQLQYFLREAVKEVLDRVKKELEAASS